MDRTRKIKDCIWTGSNSLRDQNWESDRERSLRSDCLSKAARITAAKSLKAKDTRNTRRNLGDNGERSKSSSALRFKSRLNKDTRDARGQIARGSRWYRGKKSSLGNKGEEFLNVKYITRVLIYQQAKSRCVIDNFIEDRNKVFFFLFRSNLYFRDTKRENR